VNDVERWVAGRALVVRADASSAGGTGHAMRSLALAQAWADLGGRAQWLTVSLPDGIRQRLAGEAIAIEDLHTQAGDQADAASLRRVLESDIEARAVVDGPAFDAAYLGALAPVAARVLLTDDAAGLSDYPVGFVLNQNAHADRSAYRNATARLLLGPRYVLLRREFARARFRRTIPGRARRLLVTFGGADPTRMTVRTIRALPELPPRARRDLHVRVVVGVANPDLGAIRHVAAATREPLITVEDQVQDMAVLMAWADLAISAGGSTTWELARMGCPALVVETVPIEERLVAGLARVGLFGHLGSASRLGDEALVAAIADKIEDVTWRTTMAARGRRLVDGHGARRVIEALSGGDA
jgi:UDP-2,4-diacetamido-2,4,6-trideoxy-beta-L-altropyranose hydrolase